MRKFSERLNILQIWCVCIVTLVVIIILFAFAIVHAANEHEAKLWLADLETKYSERCYQKTLIDWEVGVNMTDELADISVNLFFKKMLNVDFRKQFSFDKVSRL